jgi:hypothetical protein
MNQPAWDCQKLAAWNPCACAIMHRFAGGRRETARMPMKLQHEEREADAY